MKRKTVHFFCSFFHPLSDPLACSLAVVRGLLCVNYPKTQGMKGPQVKIRNAIPNNGDAGVVSGSSFGRPLAVKVV
ncbi:hypothetical protein CEXT_62501 [Caerostris extrusa]|uniref:Uncharacterized protein n=1 Tax=Caerostris extrusa TaxID=172846 RepID=A0AAV4M6R1_CAEEX|nr:hypothetical protein CEXT_62501 [Caerostris extrusa]